MFKNGDNIYKELDLYDNIPKQVQDDKIENVFNTNNIVREQLLNDNYIGQLRRSYKVDDDLIINSILMHLRPVLFSNRSLNEVNINDVKNKVSNTIIFETKYMNTIDNQLNMLLSDKTIKYYIREEIDKKLNNSMDIERDYVYKILIHEINNYRNRYDRHVNKITTDNIKNIYTNQMSKFKPRDIFNIINDTTERIVSDITIENNMIKNNNKLDRWTTILGDNNKHGLRSYSNIKLNEKKPPSMLFNMTF